LLAAGVAADAGDGTAILRLLLEYCAYTAQYCASCWNPLTRRLPQLRAAAAHGLPVLAGSCCPPCLLLSFWRFQEGCAGPDSSLRLASTELLLLLPSPPLPLWRPPAGLDAALALLLGLMPAPADSTAPVAELPAAAGGG
jgi:hypothetical protein